MRSRTPTGERIQTAITGNDYRVRASISAWHRSLSVAFCTLSRQWLNIFGPFLGEEADPIDRATLLAGEREDGLAERERAPVRRVAARTFARHINHLVSTFGGAGCVDGTPVPRNPHTWLPPGPPCRSSCVCYLQVLDTYSLTHVLTNVT